MENKELLEKILNELVSVKEILLMNESERKMTRFKYLKNLKNKQTTN